MLADMDVNVTRLSPSHAAAVVDCFHRVYGDSYANALFYDAAQLADAMTDGRIYSVGAFDGDLLVGHMAMTIPHADASSAELGNTVVDPRARGSGVAWQVGDELTRWCRERGYRGFLHYPTTDHHIMQRQSVKAGFETGLMLGYIPAETHGRVHADHNTLRQAATVVYQPLAASPPLSLYCPAVFCHRLDEFCAATGLVRTWLHAAAASVPADSKTSTRALSRRGLVRMHVTRAGADFTDVLDTFTDTNSAPCRHLDLCMDDAQIHAAAEAALEKGFVFCAWLPGYAHTDVLRLQQVAVDQTDMRPGVVNPTAGALLADLQETLA